MRTRSYPDGSTLWASAARSRRLARLRRTATPILRPDTTAARVGASSQRPKALTTTADPCAVLPAVNTACRADLVAKRRVLVGLGTAPGAFAGRFAQLDRASAQHRDTAFVSLRRSADDVPSPADCR
jgi:hypothetical protein